MFLIKEQLEESEKDFLRHAAAFRVDGEKRPSCLFTPALPDAAPAAGDRRI